MLLGFSKISVYFLFFFQCLALRLEYNDTGVLLAAYQLNFCHLKHFKKVNYAFNPPVRTVLVLYVCSMYRKSCLVNYAAAVLNL